MSDKTPWQPSPRFRPATSERFDTRPWPVDPAAHPLNLSYRDSGPAYVPSEDAMKQYMAEYMCGPSNSLPLWLRFMLWYLLGVVTGSVGLAFLALVFHSLT